MLFNSLDFAIYLPVVFALYWFVFRKSLRWQNMFLLVASYVFYGWWDWRYLLLIFISSAVDFTAGIAMARTIVPRIRQRWLSVSILVNLGMLAYFKYANFFLQSFADAFTLLGVPFETGRLDVVLPVGISFYTFQTLSYTIDVYRNKITPTRDPVAFFAFVSFFPQLVAGPIERASNLLPQFFSSRQFSYPNAVDGLRQILWGLFKKMVVADNCAPIVNEIFANYSDQSSSTLVLGAVLFTFQIYGDFSGYSDMAIGTARLLGFRLMQNFAYPFFARDIAEFWRRWHISLSTWFRDYLYIPLGGSRGTRGIAIRNTILVFLISGFWHGANWTFVVWGALHALFFLPLLLSRRNRKNLEVVAYNARYPRPMEVANIALTFSLVVLAFVFFRADNLTSAIGYIKAMGSASLLSFPLAITKRVYLFAFIMLGVEWFSRRLPYGLQVCDQIPWRPARWAVYYVFALIVFLFSAKDQAFIYFQF